MESKISYESTNITTAELAASLLDNALTYRKAVKGENLKFRCVTLAKLGGVTWYAAEFEAADRKTLVSVPLSKLPNWRKLEVGTWYTVIEATRHYVYVK